jgi:hypothetical protein
MPIENSPKKISLEFTDRGCLRVKDPKEAKLLLDWMAKTPAFDLVLGEELPPPPNLLVECEPKPYPVNKLYCPLVPCPQIEVKTMPGLLKGDPPPLGGGE